MHLISSRDNHGAQFVEPHGDGQTLQTVVESDTATPRGLSSPAPSVQRLTLRSLAAHDTASTASARVQASDVLSREQIRSGSVWIPKKRGAGRCNWGTLDEICRESARSHGDWCQAALDQRDLNYADDNDEEYVLEEIPVMCDTALASHATSDARAWQPNGETDTLGYSYTAQSGSLITNANSSWELDALDWKNRDAADAAWEENGCSYGTRCSNLYLSQ
jgi:hypothetical protein